MKESITKFDLEAAFKALDELEAPVAEKGIKANRPALTEIFSRKSKFDSLFEEYYDVSSNEELSDAKEAREAEIAKAKLARIEKIVDLNAESPEDLLTSYVGKFIIQCPQCMTLFYKSPEDIEESEEDENTVNVNEVCQHCGNETGYTLVGKVGAVEEDEMADYTDLDSEADETEVDVDAYDGEASDEELSGDAEEEDFNLEIDDEELDLDIEDDETEANESFYRVGTRDLTESLLEDGVSEADFETLLDTEEFKKPISDEEVQAMLAKMSKNKKTEESLVEDPSEDLNEGIFDKLKKPIGDVGTADWILKNALKNYEADAEDEANKQFSYFLAICFENEYADGKTITKAPKWDSEKLLAHKDRSKKFSSYKGAEAYGKAESSKDDCGCVIIYLANEKATDELAMLSLFFDGKCQKDQDQINNYYKEIAQAISSSKRYQKQSNKASKFELD
jgi:hypothetical protein